MINVYYNPKVDVIGLGPYYYDTSTSLKFLLVVDETFEHDVCFEIKGWLEDWECIGKLE